ncbi:MAG TPA: hypothetical protein VFN37_03090 [Candidatus Baltobacteraceae bacterium]|nr:hypothetical protein [Candidatus Baltobacteraceae bacterium]
MRLVLAAIFLCALGYTALTGYAGFLVARGIDDAKAHSVVTRVATSIMGRDAVERLAIRKGRVPQWMTQSPAFWMTLRAAE